MPVEICLQKIYLYKKLAKDQNSLIEQSLLQIKTNYNCNNHAI